MLHEVIQDNNIPKLREEVVGKDPNTLSVALLHAIYSIRPEAVTILLDAGADPNFKGWGATPLINVTSGDVARLLLSRDADPNLGAGTQTPLSSAIAGRKVPVIEALLEHSGTRVTPQNLHSAVTSFLPLDRVIRPMMQRTDPRKKVDGYDVVQALEIRTRLLQHNPSFARMLPPGVSTPDEYIEGVKKMVKSADSERSKDRQEKLTADQETFLASLSPDDRAAAEAAKGGRRKTRLRKTRRRRTLRRKQ